MLLTVCLKCGNSVVVFIFCCSLTCSNEPVLFKLTTKIETMGEEKSKSARANNSKDVSRDVYRHNFGNGGSRLVTKMAKTCRHLVP